jgi:40-residue YVTN family beta-propeller repeat/40-residue YVTN family beta-propeller repeat
MMISRIIFISVLLLVAIPGMALAAGNFAYVANSYSNTVSVIDTTSNSVQSTISVGNSPYMCVMNPAGTRLYVDFSTGVNVIDPGSNTVIATINLDNSGPRDMAISNDGVYLYVVESVGNIAIIDTRSYSITRVSLGTGTLPVGLAISPDGTKLWVACSGTNQVKVVRLSDNSVINTIAVGNNPQFVTLNPNGNYLYVSNTGSDTISKIYAPASVVEKTISTGDAPAGIAFAPSGSEYYVALSGASQVQALTNGDLPSYTINVNSAPRYIRTTLSGTAYVVCQNSNTVDYLNITGYYRIGTIAVGLSPIGFSLGSIASESAIVSQKVIRFYLHTYYLQRWSGFAVTIYDHGTLVDTETSDSGGYAGFTVLPNKEYTCNVYSSSWSVNFNFTFIPDNTLNEEQGVWVVPFTSWASSYNPGNVAIVNPSVTPPATGTGFSDQDIDAYWDQLMEGDDGKIFINYTDETGLTQMITFTLLRNNTEIVSRTTISSSNIRTYNHTFNVIGAAGNSYLARVDALNSLYGNVSRIQPITFHKKALLHGVDEGLHPLIAIIMIFGIAAASNMMVSGIVGLVMAGAAYFFYSIGWLDTVPAAGMTVGGMVITAILYLGGRKERGEE